MPRGKPSKPLQKEPRKPSKPLQKEPRKPSKPLQKEPRKSSEGINFAYCLSRNIVLLAVPELCLLFMKVF
jgi:hypothetical protein